MADLILENTVLRAPVTRPKAAMSRMAIKAIMSAYSTKPWPLSFGANNIAFSPFFII